MASPHLVDWVAEETGSECELENQGPGCYRLGPGGGGGPPLTCLSTAARAGRTEGSGLEWGGNGSSVPSSLLLTHWSWDTGCQEATSGVKETHGSDHLPCPARPSLTAPRGPGDPAASGPRPLPPSWCHLGSAGLLGKPWGHHRQSLAGPRPKFGAEAQTKDPAGVSEGA